MLCIARKGGMLVSHECYEGVVRMHDAGPHIISNLRIAGLALSLPPYLLAAKVCPVVEKRSPSALGQLTLTVTGQ